MLAVIWFKINDPDDTRTLPAFVMQGNEIQPVIATLTNCKLVNVQYGNGRKITFNNTVKLVALYPDTSYDLLSDIVINKKQFALLIKSNEKCQ